MCHMLALYDIGKPLNLQVLEFTHLKKNKVNNSSDSRMLFMDKNDTHRMLPAVPDT